MNMEIDLAAGLNDPEKAKEVVKKVQTVIDELVLSNQEFEKTCKATLATAEGLGQQNAKYLETIVALNDTIKNVHIVLGAHRDTLFEIPQMKELIISLDNYIMSSGAIKMGVISNAINKEQ